MESARRLVVHGPEGDDLLRLLRRLDRTEPGSTEIVLVSHRRPDLPPSLLRRVRVLRLRTPEAASQRAESLVAEGAQRAGARRSESPRVTTISACMIVKDEEQVLGACLEAIAPFVDEVIVYDTGSTDSTRDVARGAGATVIEGYWDESFGDARNRAMQHCTSDWMVFVDADEVAVGDPAALRRRLHAETADIVPVVIVSTTWAGAKDGDEVVVRRVARRGKVRWSGRLHEHLVEADDVTDVLATAEPAPLRLLHSGYQTTVVHEKGKRSRNVELARAAMDAFGESSTERPVLAANYGRSLILADRAVEGVSVLDEVRTSRAHPTVVVGAGRAALTVLVAAGRLEEARSWLSALATRGESKGNLCIGRARISLAEGDVAAAARALDEAPVGARADQDKDCWGASFDVGSVVPLRVAVDMASGHPDAALSRLLEQVRASPDQVDVAQLLAVADRAGAPWEEVVASVPDHFLDRSVRAVMGLGGSRALALSLRWCEAFIATHPGDHRPVVAGCVIAGGADLTTAITWAARAMEAGVEGLSPLWGYADQPGRSRLDRATALVVLADAFGDSTALAQLLEVLPQLAGAERTDLLSACGSLGVSIPLGPEDATSTHEQTPAPTR